MNLTKKMTLSAVTMLVAFLSNGETVFADHNNVNVNYDRIIQHSHDLENIADGLKDCFRDQFRYSKFYGKLISRSSKIRNHAHRLHRLGVAHGQCNWHDEIHLIDELVGELNALVDNAVYRSRHGYDRPLCGDTTRTVRRLLAKANYHVSGLEKSIHRILNKEPVLRGPIINEPAPNFIPSKQDIGYGIGAGVYRTGGYNKHDWSNRIQSVNKYQPNRSSFNSTYTNQKYRSRNSNGIDIHRNGAAFDVAGFKFYLNK